MHPANILYVKLTACCVAFDLRGKRVLAFKIIVPNCQTFRTEFGLFKKKFNTFAFSENYCHHW